MKKAIMVFLCVLLSAALCGCNYEVWDTTYAYDYAYILLPNGEVVEGAVESWKDYEGEQLQVKIDGKIYLTSSFNCTLVNSGEQ